MNHRAFRAILGLCLNLSPRFFCTSIGYTQINEVRRYIAEQEHHHTKLTFQDEFRRLLQRYDVTFEEA